MNGRHFPRLCRSCDAPMARQEDSCWNCEASWGSARHPAAFDTQHARVIMNVMELEMLRRCHEDRSALKQRVRELEAQLARKAVDGREGLE